MTVLVVGDVVDDVLVRPLGTTTVASDTEAEIVRRPGGSAANTACWLGRAGAPVRFVGRVGAADVARHTNALAAHGVEPLLVADPARPTATIVLLVDPAGERTMYVDRGANGGLGAADVPDAAWDGVTHLHLTGYTFFDPGVRAVALALLETARDRGVATSVDPSSVAFLRACGPVTFQGWVSGVDLLSPNLDEVGCMTGHDDPLTAADRLLEQVTEVVVTLGRGGVLHRARGADPVRAAAPAVDVVDTTGAGDAFCAGLLASRVTGGAVADQLAAGVRLAAECATRLGARPEVR